MLGWESSKEKTGMEEMVFDCGGDFSLYLSESVVNPRPWPGVNCYCTAKLLNKKEI